MKSKNLSIFGVVAVFILTGIGHRAPATARQQTGGVPTFQVDLSWPKVPDKWKLGDASSVAVDERDHIWILHRPRTLPADQKAMAAPPVLEFDASGTFIQAWGGPATGFEWPEREHGLCDSVPSIPLVA